MRRPDAGKLSDADCQTTRRPSIDERDDPDRRRPLVPAGCRCRKHSHVNSAIQEEHCTGEAPLRSIITG
jgi:hypothetical protein